LLLALFLALPVAAEDHRQLAALSPEAQATLRQEMLDNLIALNEILSLVRGARTHNLKNINLDLPRNKADRDHRPVRLRQSRRWPSTRCMPRASAAMSSRSRPTRGSSCS
jgi:hypothetical protein